MFKFGIVAINFAFEDEAEAFNAVVSAVKNKRKAKQKETFNKAGAKETSTKKTIKPTKDMIGLPSNFQHVSHIGHGKEVSKHNFSVVKYQAKIPQRDNVEFQVPAPPPP